LGGDLEHPIRLTGAGQVAFAATLIGLGIQGLVTRDFTAVWQPVPNGAPARVLLIYLCAAISLASGIGLLWRATAAIAARVLLAALVIWFLLWRVRALFLTSLVEGTWSCGETMAMIAAALVLCVAFASGKHKRNGVLLARVLYALALIPFGYAHFAYIKHTADMVPAWLPWRFGWAYFTGATFIAASAGILFGVLPRLAAALSALQMGLFGLLVWAPLIAKGPLNAFQQAEVATTLALTAAAWVVADSYRAAPRREAFGPLPLKTQSAQSSGPT